MRRFTLARSLPALFLAVAAVTPAFSEDDDVTLAGLRVDATAHDLQVSFTVEGAFTREIRERIDSGLPVTFRYDVEVNRRRALWFDKTLVRKTVTTTVTYDTLSRQYTLARSVNDEVAETSVAVTEAEMMRWMTQLERIRLADPSLLENEPVDLLYVRVKSLLQRRFILFFIPSSTGTGWERVGLSLSAEAGGVAR